MQFAQYAADLMTTVCRTQLNHIYRKYINLPRIRILTPDNFVQLLVRADIDRHFSFDGGVNLQGLS
jgi:hypothetical protein